VIPRPPPHHNEPPAGIERAESRLDAWLRFGNLQFSPRLAAALLQRYGNDPDAIFEASDAELGEVPGLLPRHLVRLRDQSLVATDRQRAWIERYGVRLLSLADPAYPALLRDIHDPPAYLFYRGTLPPSNRERIGIVGSRHATPYGRATAEQFARELAGQGLTVVSGGAVGIDAAAHRGALAGGGPTLAILGCGLDVDYPRENRALFEQIVQNGALLTEYPLGAPPEAWRFPARNRIISGLAIGVLVVEAPRQSGALITAEYAAEQGRPVLAIPGNIDRPTSTGTNELLKEGATLVTAPSDILRALNLITLPVRPDRQTTLELDWGPARHRKEAPQAAAPAHPSASQATIDQLPEGQRRLLECLSLTPRHLDAIAQEAGVSAVTASVEMTLLELAGFARRLPGNNYIRGF
jgi:DNA processing protein